MNNHRILVACLIIFLVIGLVMSCICLFGVGIYYWNTASFDDSSGSSGITNPQNEHQTQPEMSSETTEVPQNQDVEELDSSYSETIDPETARQMDEIQMQVIMERGLKPSENVDRKLYSPEQLNQKIIQDFDEDYSVQDLENDVISLAAFGLLDPDFDLYNFYIDLLSEQVAGFYDQETKEMAVIQSERFGGSERITYAHEYAHALQDQNYGIENGLNYNNDACETDSERCAAIQSLLEGDATLTQLNWFFANGTAEDQTDIMELYSDLDMQVFDSAPDFIALDFMFPYEQGYSFVETLYNNGGWGTVNRAYQNPPVSTEQILHPDRYPDDKPIQVKLPGMEKILGTGWEEIDRGVMGEWYTYLILAKGLDSSAHIDDGQARMAAEGWGGDAYAVYYNTNTAESVMILQSIWDSPAEADEFMISFQNYADLRFDPSSTDSWQDKNGYHSFHRQSEETTWIFAPDTATAEAVWEIIQP